MLLMCFFVVASVLASVSKTCCVNIHSLYLEYCFLVGSGLPISMSQFNIFVENRGKKCYVILLS